MATKTKGIAKYFMAILSIVFVFVAVICVNTNINKKQPQTESSSIVNNLTLNSGFTDNQYIVINGKAYSYVSSSTTQSTEQVASIKFNTANTLELIFLKDSITGLSSFSLEDKNIASVLQATKTDNGINISILYTEQTATIETSHNAEYTLGTLALNINSVLNYQNQEFVVASIKGATSLLDATTKDTAQVLNMESGTLTLSGNKTYTAKSTGRAIYQTGGTLTLTNITLDGFTIDDTVQTNYGGAVFTQAGTLNISCNIKNCSAYAGGAIGNMGTVNITGGTYSNNTANMAGGAIANVGVAIIDNGNFTTNSAEHAGAIYNTAGIMTINYATIYNNTASSNGGAIFNDSEMGAGTLTINDVEIYSNTAVGGGAISNECTLIIAGGFIHENTATIGGAIYNFEGSVTISGQTVELCENEATIGGAIANGGTLVLNQGEIHSNTATNGAGIYSSGTVDTPANVTISGSSSLTIAYNESDIGGGIYNDIYSNVTIENPNATLEGNSANVGGAIFSSGNSDAVQNIITITAGTIQLNTATSYGGAIYNNTGTICTISGGTFSENSAYLGGGAIYNAGALRISGDSEIKLNTATIEQLTDATIGVGGAIYNIAGATCTITGGTFSENSAYLGGGAIYNAGALVTSEALYSKNKVTAASSLIVGGGAIYNDTSSTCTIKSGAFSENEAYIAGVISHCSTKKITITGGTFNANKATSAGGVIHISKSPVEILGGTFSNNTASNAGVLSSSSASALSILISNVNMYLNGASANGGAIMISGYISLTLKNSRIFNNSANNGGAIAIQGGNSSRWSNINMLSSSIYNNTATTNGGAIYAYYYSQINISGGLIFGNTATSGGAIYSTGYTSSNVINLSGTSEISNNTATNGGGIYCNQGTTLSTNGGKIENNVASTSGGGIYAKGTSSYKNTISLTNATIKGNSARTAGGIAVTSAYTTLNIISGEIIDNIATSNGSQIVSSAQYFHYYGGTITNTLGSDVADVVLGATNSMISLHAALPSNVTTTIYKQGITICTDTSTTPSTSSAIAVGDSDEINASSYSSLVVTNLPNNSEISYFSATSGNTTLHIICCVSSYSGLYNYSTGVQIATWAQLISNRTIIISGTTITKATSSINNYLLAIDSSVTAIGNNAFANLSVKAVIIPDSVTSIEEQAFVNCKALTDITIGRGVGTINIDAFANCNKLSKINIKSIESWCKITFTTPASQPLYYGGVLYLNNRPVTEVNIPSTITSIGAFTFFRCSGLTNIYIPNTVTSIGQAAFNSCTGLTSVNLPSSITSIGATAFGGCTNVKQYFFKKHTSIPTLGSGVFNNINDECCIYVPFSLYNSWIVATNWGTWESYICSEYEPGLYSGYGSSLLYTWDELLSAGIVTVNGNTITGANYLTLNGLLSIPDTITTIAERAFYGCSGLQAISFGDGVTTICRRAFENCSGLAMIFWGNNISIVESMAFLSASTNGAVYVKDLKKWCQVSFEDYNANPLSRLSNLYFNRYPITTLKIPNGVDTIREFAFVSEYNIINIILPSSVSTIETGAFYGVVNLQSIYIPSSVTSILGPIFITAHVTNETVIYCAASTAPAGWASDWNYVWSNSAQADVALTTVYGTTLANYKSTVGLANTNMLGKGYGNYALVYVADLNNTSFYDVWLDDKFRKLKEINQTTVDFKGVTFNA